MKISVTLRLLVTATVISITSFSQPMDPSVTAAGGGVSKTSTMVLEWTIGELVAETVTDKKNVYSQGFHQPVLSLKNTDLGKNSVTGTVYVFPNPATSVIHIKIDFNRTGPLSVLLLDNKGSYLVKKELTANSKIIEMNVSKFAQGAYTLQVRASDGRVLQNYQVIKAQ